jgi:tetratricopeptide (TPR) repeat protein
VILGFEHQDNDSRSFLPNLNEKNLKAVPTATDNFNIIIGRDVERVMKANGITSKMSEMSTESASLVGEALNAAVVVWGTVNRRQNNMFRVSGTMRSQRSGKVAAFSMELSKIDKNQRTSTLRTEFFDRINDFAKGEIPEMFDMALSQYNNKQLDAAETAFRRIVEIDPNNLESWLFLGRIQYDQRRNREAVTFYERGLEIDPENEELLRYLSVAYRDQGLIDQSIEALERIADARAQRGEPDLFIYYNIALQFKDRNRIDNALEALDKALIIDPENELIHKLYAEITFDIGDFEKAIDHLEFVVERSPEDLDSASRLARAYQRTGQLDRAIEKYLTNIRNNPRNISAYLNLASAYVTKGQEQTNTAEKNRLNRLAIQTYLDAQKVDPNNAGIDSNIAGTYLLLEDITNAERFAQIAIRKQANLADPHIILASIAQRRGITKDTEFIELSRIYDSGELFGKEQDDTKANRDAAKREAHAFFRQADTHYRDAMNATENDRIKNELNTRIRQNNEFIERTKPGLFE